MPVACSTSVLTGADGMFTYKPAGTEACLLDFTDFAVGSKIKLPTTHNFMPGDPVKFTEEKGGKLDSALTADEVYYIGVVTSTDATLLMAPGGDAVTLAGDGGTGTADTPGGHINISYADYEAQCQIVGFTLEMSRDKIQTTSLKCRVGGAASKIAPFKTYQGGFADGTGTLRVQFPEGQDAKAQRLLSDALLNKQAGAWGKFYVNAVAGAMDSELPDDDASNVIEVPLSLEGVSLGVDSAGTDATIATVNFSFSGQPTRLFGTVIG